MKYNILIGVLVSFFTISPSCAQVNIEKEIVNAWKHETGWNEELYKSQSADIEQRRDSFSLDQYNTVLNCLREAATNKACDGYMEALHKQPFSDSELKKQYSGVQMVKKSEQLGNDPRSSQVEQIHRLYTATRNFISSKHQITAQYNAKSNSWAKFDDQKNKILKEARVLNQNPLFSEISMVPGFKDGLDVRKLENKLAGMRNTFYQQLCNQIVNHYKKAAATQDNYNRMETALVEFNKQSKNQNLVSKIAQVQYEMGRRIIDHNSNGQ